MKCIANFSVRGDWGKVIMKAVNAKWLVSLVGILLVAPFFAIALIIGARVVALSHGTQDDLLLAALALGGAAASIINGMGRKPSREKQRAGSRQVETTSNAHSRRAFMIHLGH